MNEILNPVIYLGLMGLLFGGGLAYASKIFAVKVDPKVPLVKDVLPGANCGGCGYPGCDALAVAIVNGEANINACPVGGPECAAKIGEIMGVSIDASERMIARVICNGTKENCGEKFNYYGVKDCKEAVVAMGGSKSCQYGCLGLGTCEKVCPFDAIHVNEDGIAEVVEEKCTGCGKCIDACPKVVIALVPASKTVHVDCNSKDKGKDVRSNCKVGCIGCQLCVKVCPFGAIEFENNLAKINYDKCTQCMLCAEKCPTKAISARFDLRKIATIDEEKCIGCSICAKKCPVEAIQGEIKKPFSVIEDKCIGCGVCAEKCPKDAITLK